MTLLAQNLSYHYDQKLLLDGVSMAVSPGEVVAVIGPNGAGKTTLMKLLAGVLDCVSGDIFVAGEACQRDELYQYVSYLPQKLEVYWPLRAAQVIALGRRDVRQRWYQRVLNPTLNADERVAEVLQQLDISNLAEQPVDQLSGGELTRVLLARALATDRDYLLVDEPVNNLDPAHQVSVMQTLCAEAQAGRGVLSVLHDLGLVRRYCTRVIAMADGRIVADGTPGEVLNRALLTEVFDIASGDLDYWLTRIS